MNKAFTLVELLLTMSLMSVIALMFISYTGDVGDVSVDALSWKIQADIRYAQQLATSTGVAHGVTFTRDGSYTVYRETVATPVLDPQDQQPMIEDVTHFGSVALNNTFQVEFDRLGRPTIGGGGYEEVISESGASRRIYIIDNTGSVLVDVLNLGSGCRCDLCHAGRLP